MVEPTKLKKCSVRINRIKYLGVEPEHIQDAITDQRVRPCSVRLQRLDDEHPPVLEHNGVQMRNCYIRLQRIVLNEDTTSISSHGKDETSKRLEAMFSEEKIQQQLNTAQFVPIRIASDTNAYMHFAAIYRVVPVPSIFFIGQGGTPLEIGTSLLQSADELEQKIQRVLESMSRETAQPAANVSASVPAATLEAAAPVDVSVSATAAPVCVDGVCTLPTASTSRPSVTTQSKGAKPKTTVRLAQPPQPLEDPEQEERKVREQNLREMQEKLRRERLVDQAARERVRAQIAADRKERAERNNVQVDPTGPAPSSSSPASTPTQSDTARLQFRFANGECQLHTFQSSDTMSQVRNYVRETLMANEHSARYVLATTYPKRELGPDCDELTLAELSLCPSAVILIIMLDSPRSVTTLRRRFDGVFTLASTVFWALCSPLFGLVNYVTSFVGRRPRGNHANNAVPAQAKKDDDLRAGPGYDAAMRRNANRLRGHDTSAAANPTPRENGPERRRWTGGSNIHRLSDQWHDDDEDNATWNGNSTQQQ